MPTSSQLTKTWKEVVREDQVEHREAEQRQEHEEPAEAAAALQMAVRCGLRDPRRFLQLVGHVADREEMDQRGDERDHHEHDGGQHVDAEAELSDVRW